MLVYISFDLTILKQVFQDPLSQPQPMGFFETG